MRKSFFDYYPDNIFNLLTGENKRLYLDIILVLFHDYFDEASDYDDVAFPANQIRNKIRLELIERNTLFDEETQTVISVSDGIDIQAYTNRFYGRFVECGWLKVERQGHKKHVLMSPKIMSLLEFIESAGRNLSSDVGGSVFSIYQTLKGLHKDDEITPNDIVAGLSKAADDSQLIARRMRHLAHFIRDMSEKVGEIANSSQKVDLFFDSYIKESSFKDYKDFKGPNHPFRFKSDILEMIRIFEYDIPTRQRFIDAFISIGGVDTEKASQQLVDILFKVRRVFVGADNSLNRIETCNSKLVQRVTESVKYQRRNMYGSECFTDALQLLRGKNGINDLAVSNPLPAIFSISNEAAFSPRQKRKSINPSQGTIIREVSEEEILDQQEKSQYMESIKVRDSVLSDWLDLIVTSNKDLVSTDITINTPFEFFALVQARRLCLESEEFKQAFPQTYAEYKFTTVSEEFIDHGVVICRQFEITKR